MSQILTTIDNGKSINLHVGDEALLRLPENAATGYRWAVDAADGALVDIREGEYLPLSNAIGSGGEMQWIIQAKASGTTLIKFKRWRQWEGDSSILERFEFKVQITP